MTRPVEQRLAKAICAVVVVVVEAGLALGQAEVAKRARETRDSYAPQASGGAAPSELARFIMVWAPSLRCGRAGHEFHVAYRVLPFCLVH